MLEFSATQWCPACREMESTVLDLIHMGYPVRRIDLDQDRALAARFGVQKIPCFIMLIDGVEVDRVAGLTSFGRLQGMCERAARTVAARPLPRPAPVSPPLAAKAVAVPVSASASSPSPKGPAVSDATLIAQSVRIRVEDPDGRSCGSGTIVDARAGQALVLTCGHIFRDSKGKGPIEVDLFGPGGVQRVAGRLIDYDLNSDVGLVSIRPAGQLSAARMAPAGYRIASGDAVVTVGCNNGADPTVSHSRVLAVDKFLGPHNLQVEGEPVEGRSGGGVFSSDGMVIGICNAADRNDHAAYCDALLTLQAELDRKDLSFVYKEPSKAAWSPAARADADRSSVAMSTAPPLPLEPAHEPGAAAKLAPGEQAALEKIRQERNDGAEIVVYFVRNGSDPLAKNEVLRLDNVSPAFLEQLAAESGRRETSLQRRTILEWDATAGYLHREPIPGAGQAP
jgi:thiol-disulfide isomerase/thioredoxin